MPNTKQKTGGIVLGNATTQTGIMAAIVTAIVQPLAQGFHLPDGVTISLALFVSFLCAFYHVRIIQELKKVESYVLTVLATFIIFSTALGSNTVIGKDPKAETAGLTEQKIKNLEEQIKNKNDLLRALGVEINNAVSDPGKHGKLTTPAEPAKSGIFAKATLVLVNTAFAQDDPDKSENTADKKKDEKKKPGKKDAVKAYLEKQKMLKQEQEALEKKEADSKESGQGLWKKW